MKNKGIVIVTIILALTCIYELSFTFKARNFETKAKAFATQNGKFDGEKYREYIDSLGGKNIVDYGIVKKNYFKCKDSELKLGLDLQGGMNVILEVSKMDVVKTLAGENAKSKDVAQALQDAQNEYLKNGGDYVEHFANSLAKISPNKTLSSVFASPETKVITFNTSNDDVINYLKSELKSKAQNTRQVIEARLNQGNVSQPNIQELEDGKISVELPGVDNPKRIRTLLEQSAKLEFWEVYCNTDGNQAEAYNKIYEPMNKFYAQKLKLDKGESLIDSNRLKEIQALPDSAQRDSTMKAFMASQKADSADEMPFAKAGLIPFTNGNNLVMNNAVLGIAIKTSMNKINKMLQNEYLLSKLPKDIVFAWGAEPLTKEGETYALYALKKDRTGRAALGSTEENIISDARATTGQSGGVEVNMMMTNSAARAWKDITTKNQGLNVAIVLDNKVFSAPSVNEPIAGGSSSISGSFSVEEATDLANVLKAGKLPAPARIIAEEVVGPTLGKESIREGLMSFMIGLISVIILMIFFYSRAGVIAVGSVLLNIFFIIGILASYGAALTLPGIAGIVLTIGMAVDANVLIYERIREELREGRGLKSAVKNGYKAALSSIIDGNITTLLAGFIMTTVGAGPVYGFAITLIIGILSSLFTAILISRVWIDRRLSKDKDVSFSNNATKNLLVNANYNFIGNRKKFYVISAIIIVVGMTTLIMKGGLSTGIDFKGGYGYTVQLEPGIPQSDIKGALDKSLTNSSNEVKTIGSEGRYKIVSTYKLNETNYSADSVEADVIKALAPFKATTSSILTSSKVGPTIANNIRDKSAMVVLISLIVIFIYIVIRFKKVSFGMGATIALIHDVLMVFSLFALLENIVPFSIEIDQAFIAAILTVVGYSINDSVVVFDRIREYLTEYKSETNVAGLINKAINQTLTRTIMTSGTTLIVILSLFLFGGAALKGFSLALLIGIGIGTYSSICIAAPIVVDMFKKNKTENN
jgi:SecD/SecF fusion protein